MNLPDLIVGLNIIVLWNTVYMEAALAQLREEGYPVSDEDLRCLSPLLHEHINMLGRYSFLISDAIARAPSGRSASSTNDLLKPLNQVFRSTAPQTHNRRP